MVINITGKPILHVKLQKSIYSYLNAALLFCEKLDRDIQMIKVVIKSYDPCVANKMVNGKQLTMIWHMDNLKLSHVYEREATRVIEGLEVIYAEMRVAQGKKCEYLGMGLDFSAEGKVNVIMIKNLKGSI